MKDSTGVMKDSTGALFDSTGVMKDSTGVMKDSTGALFDSTGVMKDSTAPLTPTAVVRRYGGATRASQREPPSPSRGERGPGRLRNRRPSGSPPPLRERG
jgi:hypothetical protein